MNYILSPTIRKSYVAIILIILGGCASSTAIPLQADTLQIKSRAALACGADGAARVAYWDAAKQTLRRGYDKFMIVGGGASNTVRVVGHTPIQTRTSLSGTYSGHTHYGRGYSNTLGRLSGSGMSTTTGGMPIYGGKFNQDYIVKMFQDNDPAARNALSARDILGADWQTEMNKRTTTCFVADGPLS